MHALQCTEVWILQIHLQKPYVNFSTEIATTHGKPLEGDHAEAKVLGISLFNFNWNGWNCSSKNYSTAYWLRCINSHLQARQTKSRLKIEHIAVLIRLHSLVISHFSPSPWNLSASALKALILSHIVIFIKGIRQYIKSTLAKVSLHPALLLRSLHWQQFTKAQAKINFN